MFLGYQNNKIVLAANTRAEIENAPLIETTKIEETAEEYVLQNGKYVKASDTVFDKAEIQHRRRQAFEQYTDVYLLERLEDVATAEQLFAALTDWKAHKTQIREQLPYA